MPGRIAKYLFFTFLLFFTIFSLPLFSEIHLELISFSKPVLPGNFVTSVFSLINNTELETTFTLKAEIPSGWSLLAKLTPLTLGPHKKENLFLTYYIPSRAQAGNYSLRVKVSSPLYPELTASAVALIEVAEVRKVKLKVPSGGSGRPGQIVHYFFRVINEGNVSDTFQVFAFSLYKWKVLLSTDLLELSPGGKKEVQLDLFIPEKVSIIRKDFLKIKVISLLAKEVSDEGIISTSLLPPLPQEIRGTLYEEIPARLILYSRGSLTKGDFISGVGLDAQGKIDKDRFLKLRANLSDINESKVSEFLFALQTKRWDLTLGDTSVNFTPLVGFSGRGIKLCLTDIPFLSSQTSFFAMDGEKSFLGGNFIKEDLKTTVGLTTMQEKEGDSRKEISDLLINYQPTDKLTFSVEKAISDWNEKKDGAWRISSQWKDEKIFLKGEYLRAGTNYPGLKQNLEGPSLIYRHYLNDNISLGFNLSRFKDNVELDSTQPALVRDNVKLNFHHKSKKNLFYLPPYTLEIDWEKVKSEELFPSTNEEEKSLQFTFSDYLKFLSYFISGRIGKKCDYTIDSESELTEWKAGLGLRFNRFSSWLWHTESRKYDPVSRMEDSSSRQELKLSYQFMPGRLSTNLNLMQEQTLEENKTNISLEGSYKFNYNTQLSLKVKRKESTLTGSEWCGYFNLHRWFNLPFFLSKSKTRLEGFVFFDYNADSHFNKTEKGVPDLILSIGKIRVSTDSNGYYKFPPLKPGEYRLEIEGLPFGWSSKVPLPYSIKLARGKVQSVNIPLVKPSMVRGTVFEDRNRNGTREIEEEGISGVKLILTSEISPSRVAFTDSQGNFVFFALFPGEYKLKLDEATLPEYFESTTPKELSFTLEQGREVLIMWGAARKERKIIITF